MEINFTTRHMEMTPSLQDYAKKKLERAIKHFPDRIKDLQIVLEIEKSRHKVEVKLIGDGFSIQAKEETSSMYTSIDQVVDKIEKQLKRYKERITSRKKKNRREKRRAVSLGLKNLEPQR